MDNNLSQRPSTSTAADSDNPTKLTNGSITRSGDDAVSQTASQAAGHLADEAVKSAQRLTKDALDGLANALADLRHGAAPLLAAGAVADVSALAKRGMDVLRDTTRDLGDRAQRASDRTESYIQDQPMKSVLIAAATGAALMALVAMLVPTRRGN